MTFTMNQIVLLALMLVIGLILGLMMSGRGKYKGLWRDEQRAHGQTRKDRDARVEAANQRIAELERQPNAIGPGTATAVAGAAHGRDDLTKIRTISRDDEISLNEAGYHRYAQIAVLNKEQEATLEGRLGYRPGLIARDEWVRQALLLNDGREDEHARLYDRHGTAV